MGPDPYLCRFGSRSRNWIHILEPNPYPRTRPRSQNRIRILEPNPDHGSGSSRESVKIIFTNWLLETLKRFRIQNSDPNLDPDPRSEIQILTLIKRINTNCFQTEHRKYCKGCWYMPPPFSLPLCLHTSLPPCLPTSLPPSPLPTCLPASLLLSSSLLPPPR